MPKEYGMRRRDFLGIMMAAFGAASIAPNPTNGRTVTGFEPVNEGNRYNLAKKVWDLSQKAWSGRYLPQGYYRDVMGVLNLAPTGPGHYIMIKSRGSEQKPSKFDSARLNLIAVNGIEPATTKRIDDYLAKLGLRYHVPISASEDKIEKMREQAGYFRISIAGVAVDEVWNEIIHHSKEHKLPVLYLQSDLDSMLGSLQFVGIREEGGEPKDFDICQFNKLPEEAQKKIIERVYAPLLAKAVPLLKKEVKLIGSRRLKDKNAPKEKTPDEIAQMILKYQMQ